MDKQTYEQIDRIEEKLDYLIELLTNNGEDNSEEIKEDNIEQEVKKEKEFIKEIKGQSYNE